MNSSIFTFLIGSCSLVFLTACKNSQPPNFIGDWEVHTMSFETRDDTTVRAQNNFLFISLEEDGSGVQREFNIQWDYFEKDSSIHLTFKDTTSVDGDGGIIPFNILKDTYEQQKWSYKYEQRRSISTGNTSYTRITPTELVWIMKRL